jgi:hypothetical protein
MLTGTTPAQGLVTGYLPLDVLPQLPAVPGYVAITPVYAPQFSATDQTSAVIGADAFRASPRFAAGRRSAG